MREHWQTIENVTYMKHLNTVIILTCLGALIGCSPAPRVPQFWTTREITYDQVNDDGQSGRLQVFTSYNGYIGAHAALRLVCPGRPTLMWDPGGNYGEDDPEICARTHDYLIWEKPPDVKTYMDWRIQVSNVATEVFEFDLTQAQAEHLWDILKNGTPEDHPQGRFTHGSAPVRCCIDVSDYLNRFCGDVVQIPKTYIWPHALAKVLYTQRPQRVICQRQRKPLRELTPPK